MRSNEKISEMLYPIINETWSTLKRTCQSYSKKDRYLIFDESGFSIFKSKFEALYSDIMKSYMKPNVKELDRHKVAAVMIIACIDAKLISYQADKMPKNLVFIGAEMIATEVALSWMIEGLNNALNTAGIREGIKHYVMPTAFACDTPYFEIFCRNLLYAQKNYNLNPLDISEKLFLLEYITLLENRIDPKVLKRNV